MVTAANYSTWTGAFADRAGELLATGSRASLLYAALEIRMGAEARLQSYVQASDEVTAALKRGWQVHKLFKGLERTFSNSNQVVRFTVRTQDREVEMHFIPVRQRLLDHVNRFGNALHYSSGGHADDAWWGDLELSARDALQELRVCAKATLLGVPLMRTDSTEVLTKFEFPAGDARAAYLMDLAHSGSEHQFLVDYIPTEFFYMTERGDAAPVDVAQQQQP